MAKNSRILRNNRVILRNKNQENAARYVSGLSSDEVLTRSEMASNIKNTNLSMEERVKYMFKIQKLSRDGSKTRIRNRCNKCGRSRGYRGFFGLCRCCIYELSREGTFLFGVKKSSW